MLFFFSLLLFSFFFIPSYYRFQLYGQQCENENEPNTEGRGGERKQASERQREREREREKNES
jgi:hypothetical protein